MASRRAVIAFLLVQFIALAASAQSAEFGRATSGDLVLTPKASSTLSGSLEVSMSTGDVFGRENLPAYGIMAGATLIQDRLWFFGAASRQEISQSRYAGLELPENATTGAIGARVNAHLGDAHDFSAFFESARRPELSMTATSPFAAIVPSSFLSLRYTGVLSSNMFFSASVTRSERTVPGLAIVPAN